MSRTILELTPGEIVMVDELNGEETVSVPYIYIKQSDDGAACLLLRQSALLAKRMHSSNDAEYQDCEMDTWLNSTDGGFLDTYLPTAVQNALVSSQMTYYSVANETLVTITRMVRLLTYTECGWSSANNEGVSVLAALKTAADTTTDNTARICYNSVGSAISWWLASPASAAAFRCVNTTGVASSNNASSAYYYARPVLSVSPDTIVSDETEDTIYLLPDSEKLYREVEATIYMGACSSRPTAARLDMELTNLYDTTIQISNNAKDAAPVWEDISVGGTAEFSNSAKETDAWELGVHVYGKSGGLGTVGEPIMIITKEAT